MKRQYDLVGLGLMTAAAVLALIQWVVSAGGNTLPSFVEFLQTWVIITGAVLWVSYLAVTKSNDASGFVRTVFTSPASLPLPATILAYLSTTWFSGFHEKYDVAAWHNGLALKGFWLGTIAQGHPSAANPFPNVHYSFWVNLLQWNVDHSVFSWFGYVVIGAELFIAVSFITALLAVFYRPMLLVAIAGTLLGLLFHFFFLMSGSAGVNALMPYLTAIAAITLVAVAVARPTKAMAEIETTQTDSPFTHTMIIASNKTKREDRIPVPSR